MHVELCAQYKQIWSLKNKHIYIYKTTGMNIMYLKINMVRNCHMDCSRSLFKLFLEAREKGKCEEKKENQLQFHIKPDTISNLSFSGVMTAIKIKGYKRVYFITGIFPCISCAM